MNIQYKTITANTQVCGSECYLMGVELSNAAATSLIIYDESTSNSSADRKVVTLRVSAQFQDARRKLPLPGIKCDGIYAKWAAGVGTVYYYTK
ncbi:MAG TPA: hypothetical protein ENI23_01535 [bacterium]|nr:hypothetical protein [bacterium]